MKPSNLRQIDRALEEAGRAIGMRGRITSQRAKEELFRRSEALDRIPADGSSSEANRKRHELYWISRWLPAFRFWGLAERAEHDREGAAHCSSDCRERLNTIASICKELRRFAADPVRDSLRYRAREMHDKDVPKLLAVYEKSLRAAA